MKTIFIIEFVAAITLLTGTLSAQDQEMFSIDARMKTRFEYREGYRMPNYEGSKPAFEICQRSRLGFNFNHKWISLRLAPQDVRLWGESPQLNDETGLGIYEAWAQFSLAKNVQVKLGRQELIYDDHRLLGNVDWVGTGRTHDALVIKYEVGRLAIDAGGGYSQDTQHLFGTEYRTGDYKILAFAHTRFKASDGWTVNLIFLSDAFEKGEDDHHVKWRYTMGPHIIYRKDKLTTKLTAYWQGGKKNDSINISAYFLHASLGYQTHKKLYVELGADIVSGDNPKDRTYEAFNTMYATNHKFYGFMDHYLSIPADTRGGGLQDYYLHLQPAFSDRLKLDLWFHQLLLANKVPTAAESNEMLHMNLGEEIDLVFSYVINPWIKFSVGGSMYLPTNTTAAIKGGDGKTLSGWAFTMLDITPTLFTSKKKIEQ